jgi:hypothetical protein
MAANGEGGLMDRHDKMFFASAPPFREKDQGRLQIPRFAGNASTKIQGELKKIFRDKRRAQKTKSLAKAGLAKNQAVTVLRV